MQQLVPALHSYLQKSESQVAPRDMYGELSPPGQVYASWSHRAIYPSLTDPAGLQEAHKGLRDEWVGGNI